MTPDAFFAVRESHTAARVRTFRESFERHLQADGAELLADDACVYAVGSAGRGDMTSASDLDLFFVTHASYRRTHEILAKAAVLRMMAQCQLPDPSNDAGFLKLHTADSLARRMGDVQDDVSNTFTVRMLLLLESRPIYGNEAYTRLLDRVLNAYWKNESGPLYRYLVA